MKYDLAELVEEHPDLDNKENRLLPNVLPVRLNLIKDVGAFYFSICKHPNQEDYARLYERFPELRHINKDKYWVS